MLNFKYLAFSNIDFHNCIFIPNEYDHFYERIFILFFFQGIIGQYVFKKFWPIFSMVRYKVNIHLNRWGQIVFPLNFINKI